MRLRKGILEDGGTSVLVYCDQWVSLVEAGRKLGVAARFIEDEARDVLKFLALKSDVKEKWLEIAKKYGKPAKISIELPFTPLSFRDSALFSKHMAQATKGFVPLALKNGHALQLVFGTLIGKKLRLPFLLGPSRKPAYYVGNPLTFIADDAEAKWPSHGSYLDVELEVALILGSSISETASIDAIEDAILQHGAFVLINDFSARDTQLDELCSVQFGFVKSKSFCTSMATDVITADELWTKGDGGKLFGDGLRCKVQVNEETWAQGTTAEHRVCSLAEFVKFAALDEGLAPGELLGLGTVPNCCGIEIQKQLRPGDVVTLSCDQLGTLTNTIGTPPPGIDFKHYGVTTPVSRLKTALHLVALAVVVPPLSFFSLLTAAGAALVWPGPPRLTQPPETTTDVIRKKTI